VPALVITAAAEEAPVGPSSGAEEAPAPRPRFEAPRPGVGGARRPRRRNR
jgi:hypothetical protein